MAPWIENISNRQCRADRFLRHPFQTRESPLLCSVNDFLYNLNIIRRASIKVKKKSEDELIGETFMKAGVTFGKCDWCAEFRGAC